MADTALLSLALASTGAIITASGFIINGAFKFGRHMQIIADLKEKEADRDARLEAIDRKVERHLQWHEEVLPLRQSQGDLG